MECEKAFTFATRTARKREQISDWFRGDYAVKRGFKLEEIFSNNSL
jgi:hypothetical protein